jgi:two-component system sensor histidine kinase KdpD
LQLRPNGMGLEPREAATNHLDGVLTRQVDRLPWANIRAYGVRIALAMMLVGATTGAILALANVVDLRHTLAIYLIPVLAATLWWNFAIGLVTALVSALVAAFFFFDPIFSFYVANPVELVGLLIFVAVAIVIG